jgi:hypothetical protein
MKNTFSKKVLNIDVSGVRKMFEMGKNIRKPIARTGKINNL